MNFADLSAAEQSMLLNLQRDAFRYFQVEANPELGLIKDASRSGSHTSIAVTGLGLAAYTVGVHHGFITEKEAVERALKTLRFFWRSEQSRDPRATGYQGFYYHFLDLETGRRAWQSELSTIDTALLLAGALAAAAFFGDHPQHGAELRDLALGLYRRVNWQWMARRNGLIRHGWKPERGFLPYVWDGYNEALLLYILALASPTYPIPTAGYDAWTKTYSWETHHGISFLFGAPLFVHQLSHIWLDLRALRDAPMRAHSMDYFENSRRATYAQQAYACANPHEYKGYGENCWGFTASDGPGRTTKVIDGIKRKFYGYKARGIGSAPDDGTIAPWAAIASLPFAPEIVLPAIHHFNENYPQMISEYGFKCSFNPTFPGKDDSGWVSDGYFGLDQGPIVMMIENFRSGFFWELMRGCEFIALGLRRAGFQGGWLDRNPGKTFSV